MLKIGIGIGAAIGVGAVDGFLEFSYLLLSGFQDCRDSLNPEFSFVCSIYRGQPPICSVPRECGE